MALTAALLAPWLSACGWLQNCRVAAGDLAGRSAKSLATRYAGERGLAQRKGIVQVLLPLDASAGLRLAGVPRSLPHWLGSLGRGCASCEGLLTSTWAETFCRGFLPSQDGTRLEAITESSSPGHGGVCDGCTWVQMSTVDKYG